MTAVVIILYRPRVKKVSMNWNYLFIITYVVHVFKTFKTQNLLISLFLGHCKTNFLVKIHTKSEPRVYKLTDKPYLLFYFSRNIYEGGEWRSRVESQINSFSGCHVTSSLLVCFPTVFRGTCLCFYEKTTRREGF